MVGIFFYYHFSGIFLYFHSCDSHFRTCYHSVILWQQTGIGFASSSVAIYPIWVFWCCNSISCSLSKLLRCRIHTIHLKQPFPCKTSTFDVNMTFDNLDELLQHQENIDKIQKAQKAYFSNKPSKLFKLFIFVLNESASKQFAIPK